MKPFPDRLYDYEVTPPDGVWNRISEDLDDASIDNRFPTTLHELEVQPPARAWNRIASTLDGEATPVVPMHRRPARFIRYAAAVLILGVLGWGALQFTGKDSADAVVASNPDTPTPTTVPATDTNKQVQAPVAAATDAPIATQPKNANQLPQRRAEADNNRVQASRNNDVTTAAIYTFNDHIPNLGERYITLMTPEGGFIRLSKKWSELVCCVAGEDEDADCQSQLKKWQRKIAASPVAAPGNFVDLLDLVSSLNDDTQL